MVVLTLKECFMHSRSMTDFGEYHENVATIYVQYVLLNKSRISRHIVCDTRAFSAAITLAGTTFVSDHVRNVQLVVISVSIVALF